jgi:hypothetical protein
MGRKNTRELKTKHRFFLSPYEQYAFTRCPRCEGKTNIRKFPLAIHIEADPIQLFVLNKTCRYCTRCDLIIAKKSELEALMAAAFEPRRPEIVGNKYLVFGVLEREDWRLSDKGRLPDREVIERVLVFKQVLNFEVIPGGWYPDPDRQRQNQATGPGDSIEHRT